MVNKIVRFCEGYENVSDSGQSFSEKVTFELIVSIFISNGLPPNVRICYSTLGGIPSFIEAYAKYLIYFRPISVAIAPSNHTSPGSDFPHAKINT